VVDAHRVRGPLGTHGAVVHCRSFTRAGVLQPTEAPAPGQRGLLVERIAKLHVTTVAGAAGRVVRRHRATRDITESQDSAEALRHVPTDHDRQLLEIATQADGASERTEARATRVGRVRRGLPETTGPRRVLVLAGPLVPGQFGFHSGYLRVEVRARPDDARLEETDAQLCRRARPGRIRHLRVEVGIDVAVTDPAQRRPTTTATTHPHGADAEQGLVIQDVLASEQRELAAREDLAPLTTHGQIYLAHVDLRAGLSAVSEVVVRGPAVITGSGTRWHTVVDLRRKPKVDCQVHPGFLAACLERRERRQEAGANARVGWTTLRRFREYPERIHVPREGERPAIRHLHRQALRPGRRRDAERETQQQQRETLHTRTP